MLLGTITGQGIGILSQSGICSPNTINLKTQILQSMFKLHLISKCPLDIGESWKLEINHLIHESNFEEKCKNTPCPQKRHPCL